MKQTKKYFIVSLITLLMFAILPTYSCSPMYVKTIPIRVIDYNYRPIENAHVSVYYQITSSITKGGEPKYTYTKEYSTNASGRVDITIRNLERSASKVDCNIKIKARLFDYEVEEKVNIDEMPKMNLIRIPARILTVNIYDQNLNPLEGRLIIGDESYEVNGSRQLFVPEGKRNILIVHNFRKKSYEIEIKDSDITLTSVFNYRDITFRVMDEKGNLLPFTLINKDKEYQANGFLTIRIPAGTATMKILVAGEEIDVDVNTEEKQSYSVFIDRSPPKIYSLDVKQNDMETVIDAIINDEGVHSSGIKKVYGKLTFEDGTVLEKEFINVEGDMYELGVEKSGTFEFQITVYDKENNILILKGRHEVTYEDTPVEVSDEGDFLPYIIGILVIGLIGGAIYVKKKLQEMEEL